MPTLAIFLNGTAVGGIRETTALGTSDNFTSGVTFTTSVALDTPGTYHFCFDATDGPGLAAAQLCADAPIVVALLDAVAGPLAPGSGAKGEGQVKYSGQGVMSQWKCSSGAPNAIDLAFVCIGCAWALRRKRRD